jgi:hypothetical protein
MRAAILAAIVPTKEANIGISTHDLRIAAFAQQRARKVQTIVSAADAFHPCIPWLLSRKKKGRLPESRALERSSVWRDRL